MKRPISLWIFGIGGMITNIFSGIIFYLVFYLYTQLYLLLWIIFPIIAGLFILSVVVSYIGMLRLKKWGRNIFVIITLIMNSLMILLLPRLEFLLMRAILTVFTISFVFYFLKPSTREMFNKKLNLSGTNNLVRGKESRSK